MISTASDFYRVTGADVDADHPHGDLDRIDLGWSAWLGRRGVGSAVRGDDIAFLMDFAQRRNYMATSGRWLDGGEYVEINPVIFDGVTSTTWPCYEGEVAAEFSRTIATANFGETIADGLYAAFALKMAKNVAFFPYQTSDSFSAVVDGNSWNVVKAQLGAMTLDVSGLKSAADFSGTNPPVVAADVQAYANKIFNADQKYGFFYLGDAGVGATYPNAANGVSPGKYGSGATVVTEASSWYSGDSGGESFRDIYKSISWGCGEYEYDNSSVQYACGWQTRPKDGTVLFSLVAPHAAKIIAACAFTIDFCFEDGSLGASRYLLRTCPMAAKSGGTFELTAASATGGMNPLSLAGAVGFPTTVQDSGFAYLKDYEYHIDCSVYPIVFLDDRVYTG